MSRFLTILFLFLFTLTKVNGQANVALDTLPTSVVYKVINGDTLKMDIYHPEKILPHKEYPAIVFFFGGGWQGDTIDQFRAQAKYFRSRGMVTILVDYRVEEKHQTTPFDAVKDAKSAMRYLRKHATELHIDSDKIIASGGSAGGHLAAAASMLKGLNEEGEDTTISSKANALIMYNPVIDNGPNGYGYERVGERYKEISPLHNIEEGAPPTIFFLGSKDRHIPVKTAYQYKNEMEKVGSRCEVIIYKNQSHGFFNKGRQEGDKCYIETTIAADEFLQSMNYLKGKPTIK